MKLISIPLLFAALTVLAQKPPMKFGKVDNADLEMTIYAKDSSASAVILGDYGESMIDYTQQFEVVFVRHLRVKILTKDGLDWADHFISYYSPENGKNQERVNAVKGITYNLSGGKVVQTKLAKDAIFDSQENKYRREVKISMPQVKVGSIVDISYRIVSPFLFNYRDWQFQYSIPSRWSEYRPRFIEYYVYKQYMQGYLPLTTNETTMGSQMFTIRTQATDATFQGERQSGRTDTYTAESKQMRMVMKDVPAFKKEPYLSTADNYVSKIVFELAGKDFPGSSYQDLMGSWAKVNESFVKSEDFYKRMTGSPFLNKVVEETLNGQESTEVEKANSIFWKVKNKLSWNGYIGTTTSQPLRAVYNEGEGSAAEVNLTLASMLFKAGIKVEPVLISTRKNGIVRTSFPVVDQFNYVICKAFLDGKIYLLDATDPYLPMGALPERCLNGKGLVIAESGPDWIPLRSNAKHNTRISITASLSNDGVLSGNIEKRLSGYAARRERAAFYQDSVEYQDNLSKHDEWEIIDVSLNNFDDYSKPIGIKQQFEYEMEESGNVTYVNPVLIPMWKSNPFKIKKRNYPVDFASLISKMIYITIELPPGMIIESVPESKAIGLPNNAGKFVYNATQQGSKLVIMNKLDLTETIFNQDEYQFLKEFFEQFIQMQEQLVVLKKT